MSEFACPQCRAEIQADLIETTGAAECPFCGADLSSLGLPEPEPAAVESTDAMEIGGTYADSTNVSQRLPAVPAKSQIKVVEATEARLVIYIPGGGAAAGGLGCFALLWNGFMVVFTSAALFGGLVGGKNDKLPILGLAAFLSLFWAVGLGMAYFWVRMKFERTFLLLERQRIVVQKILFNRKRVEETLLTPASCAELVESYQQNDTPVYRIEVKGQTRAAKFGTSLSDAEKDWLVDRINDFLAPVATADGGAAAPGSETEAGAGLLAEPPPPRINDRLEPGSLPSNVPITIDEDSRELLKFHFAAAQNQTARWSIAGMMLVFSLIWYGILSMFFLTGRQFQPGFHMLFQVLFMVPFFAAGLIPLAVALMALFGVIRVSVSHEMVSCRWSVGPFRWTKSLPSAAISTVRFESGAKQDPPGGRVRRAGKYRSRKNQISARACVVRAGDKKMPVTLFQDDEVIAIVASLICTRLKNMGYTLRDA